LNAGERGEHDSVHLINGQHFFKFYEEFKAKDPKSHQIQRKMNINKIRLKIMWSKWWKSHRKGKS
jgi:hypothetical protein